MKNILFILAVTLNLCAYAADLTPLYEKTHNVKAHYDSLDYKFSPDSRYILERRFSSGTSVLDAQNGAEVNRNIGLATYEFNFSNISDEAFIDGMTVIEGKVSSRGWYRVNFVTGTSVPVLNFSQYNNIEEILPITHKKLVFLKYKSAAASSESKYLIANIENGSSLCEFDLNKNFQFQTKGYRDTYGKSLSEGFYFSEVNAKLTMALYSDDGGYFVATYNCKNKIFEINPSKTALDYNDRPHMEFMNKTGRYLVVRTKLIRPDGRWGSEVDRVNVFDLFDDAKLILAVDGKAFWDQKNDLLIVQDGAAKLSIYDFLNSVRLERNISAKIQDDNKKSGIYIKSANFIEDRLWLFYEYQSDFRGQKGLGYYDFADINKDIIHVADNVSPNIQLSADTFKVGENIIFPANEQLGVVFKKLNLKTNVVQTYGTNKPFYSYRISPDGKLLALKNIFNSNGIKETLTVFPIEK